MSLSPGKRSGTGVLCNSQRQIGTFHNTLKATPVTFQHSFFCGSFHSALGIILQLSSPVYESAETINQAQLKIDTARVRVKHVYNSSTSQIQSSARPCTECLTGSMHTDTVFMSSN
ncbi:hypothetical protein J6590_019766 [Homalodisca vitripennis]|nr:hypothetical protein J6590_019766 [Homalodisca vitripennis]